jgi:hypothetical protein
MMTCTPDAVAKLRISGPMIFLSRMPTLLALHRALSASLDAQWPARPVLAAPAAGTGRDNLPG